MTAPTCTNAAPAGRIGQARRGRMEGLAPYIAKPGTRTWTERVPSFLTIMESRHEPPLRHAIQTPAPMPTEASGSDLMTWTRFDDGWPDRPVFEDMPYDARWHYFCLIEFCSRTSRYDGVVKATQARRCSDLPDPDTALAALAAAELVVFAADGSVRLPFINEHIPPPHMRDEERKQRQRDDTRRHRAHRAGDHSLCRSERCPRVPVSTEVSAYTGTGQDGPGREVPDSRQNADTATERAQERWASGYDE